jgi:hypothetical protein
MIVGPTFDECGNEEFLDNTPETWVRLGEAIPVFTFEKEEKLRQEDVGIIRMRVRWMLAPAGMGLKTGDHVILLGRAYIIVDIATELGVTRMRIDEPKSRFVRPARTDPTYRILSVGASIQ